MKCWRSIVRLGVEIVSDCKDIYRPVVRWLAATTPLVCHCCHGNVPRPLVPSWQVSGSKNRALSFYLWTVYTIDWPHVWLEWGHHDDQIGCFINNTGSFVLSLSIVTLLLPEFFISLSEPVDLVKINNLYYAESGNKKNLENFLIWIFLIFLHSSKFLIIIFCLKYL